MPTLTSRRQPRPRRRSCAAAGALLALVLVVAGCGDDVEPLGTGAPAPIDELGCDDGEDCPDGVELAGHEYEITCAQPDPADLGDVVGGPGSAEDFGEARALTGELPELVVALKATRGPSWCPGKTPLVLAIAGPESLSEAAMRLDEHLRCEVPAVPVDPRCGEDGPFWP